MPRPYPPPLNFKTGLVDMNHGAGGRASQQLIDELFVRAFANPALIAGDDGAIVDLPAGQRLVLATDGHVVSPLFFPGGDIGSLAVHGTLNDVAMLGARPLALCAGFILEEGLPLGDLRRIVESMAAAARHAEVPIVAGDTKVVARGQADKLFISTTASGALPQGRHISGANAKPGDRILVSGTLGDHGVAILSQRESFSFTSGLRSDSAALHGMVGDLLAAVPEGAVHCLRDPTRGGLATSLNEIAGQSAVGMQLEESALPLRAEVEAACELLGLDPLYLANEGKLVALVEPAQAALALDTLRQHPLGRQAADIGEVVADAGGFVQMRTRFGGVRLLDWLHGEALPRIC